MRSSQYFSSSEKGLNFSGLSQCYLSSAKTLLLLFHIYNKMTILTITIRRRITGIFIHDNPSVQSNVINGVLLTNNDKEESIKIYK